MKFTKILPVLAATALLTGCNLFKSGPSFKAPGLYLQFQIDLEALLLQDRVR